MDALRIRSNQNTGSVGVGGEAINGRFGLDFCNFITLHPKGKYKGHLQVNVSNRSSN